MATRKEKKKARYIQLLQETPAITTDSMWNKDRHLLDKTDPRYKAVESDLLREQWFRQYVQQLKKACFIQLLQTRHEITQHSRFQEFRSFIDTDPRYNALDTGLHRLQLFSQYVEQLADKGNDDKDFWLRFGVFISIDGPVSMVFKPSHVEQPPALSNLDEVSCVLQVDQAENTETVSNKNEDNQIIQIQLHAEIKEFANWTKCVLAQTKTREALVIVVKKSFDMLIKETIDGIDLLIFLECMENQNVFHIKNKRKDEMSSKKHRNKKSIWNCQHSTCTNFFKTLVEHYIPPQTDQWDIYPSTKTKQYEIENRNLTQENQACASPEKEAKRGDISTLSEERMWLIAKLYKFTESQDKENETFQDLDISQVIKLQRCCSLFEFDDSARIYDSIIKHRNKLMHSKDNFILSKDLKEIFEIFTVLLEAFEKEFDVCARVLKELKEFEQSALEITVDHDMVQTFQEEAKQALQTKQKALENDISQLETNEHGIENDISQLETNGQALENDISQLKTNEQDIENEKSQLETNGQALENDKSQLETNGQTIENDISQLEPDENDISNLVDISNPEIKSVSDLKRLLKETMEKECNLENEMNEMEREIKKLKEINLTANRSYNSVQTDLRYVYLTKKRDLETKLKSKDEENTASKQKVTELDTLMKTKEEEVKRTKLEKTELERLVKIKDEENQALKQKIKQLEAKIKISHEDNVNKEREQRIHQLIREKDNLMKRKVEIEIETKKQMNEMEHHLYVADKKGRLTRELKYKLDKGAELIKRRRLYQTDQVIRMMANIDIEIESLSSMRQSGV